MAGLISENVWDKTKKPYELHSNENHKDWLTTTLS
jgi:hypothetical protein